MLSVCSQTLSSSLQRVGVRYIASVVPDEKIQAIIPKNEPILQYLKGSKERENLEKALAAVTSNVEEVPIVIGGERFKTNDVRYQVMPHNHGKKIAKFYYATPEIVNKAIAVATKTQVMWDRTPFSDRFAIWEKAANLMSKEYRGNMNASCMLGQSKTVFQAEIDSAAELIDFFRFHAYFLKEALQYKPISENPSVTKNSMLYRGLEGFIASISPFNFTAIGGNLTFTPALMGNAVVWKPSDTALLSSWTCFKICEEAGVPPGVVNFVPCDGPVFGSTITKSPYLSGVNFTGSVPTFVWIWQNVSNNIERYKNFPKLSGECGGKNFHFIHPSANVESAVNHTIRSAYEYCGQKCSACSRLYVPESLWPAMSEGMIEKIKKLKIGNVTEYDTFTGAVIDDKAFSRIAGYIEHAKKTSSLEIIVGGKYDNSVGYFIHPTIVTSKDPMDKILREEIFGPILSVFVYKDKEIDKALELADSSTPFGLTGAIFAEDEKFLKHAMQELKYAAGNVYINDKSTGAVVGQQPFGGARLSGTNDKAGGPHHVLRFSNPQCVKETFVPLKDIYYPYMSQL